PRRGRRECPRGAAARVARRGAARHRLQDRRGGRPRRQDRRRLPGRGGRADRLSHGADRRLEKPRRQAPRRLSARPGGPQGIRVAWLYRARQEAVNWLTDLSPDELTAIRLSLWVDVGD